MAKRTKSSGGARDLLRKGVQLAIIPGLGVDVPELQRARALWGLNRFDESLRIFEEAVRTHPQNLVALVDASRALGARFEIRRAELQARTNGNGLGEVPDSKLDVTFLCMANS